VAAEGGVLRRLGEYRILREVGRGGMGIVFEAVQESLGRHVALKVLPFHAVPDPRHVERFRREARAVAALHHTNIVPVFDFGEADGVHYYAMQFIHGQPLDQVLREVSHLRRHPRGGHPGAGPAPAASPAQTSAWHLMAGTPPSTAPEPLAGGGATPAKSPASSSSALLRDSRETSLGSPHARYFRNVAGLGLQAAEALAYAHDQGVLHRDIKPSNLLLDTEDRIWLTDFGLAKAEEGEHLTQTGYFVGTLAYTAPERFKGWSDARSDIYSLGVTLFECLTLRLPFQDTDRARLIRKVTDDEPPRPRKLDPHVPRDLETIVLKTLEKEPARRYRNAPELARDLRSYLEDRPIAARRAGRAERAWRWCRRNPGLATLGALAAVLALSASLALWIALWLRGERDLARHQHEKAVQAEKEAGYWRILAEVRARRHGGEPGQRVANLAAIGAAAIGLAPDIMPEEVLGDRRLELRNQAIACLALDDFSRAKSWAGHPPMTRCLAFDPDFTRYARADYAGNVSLRAVADDRELEEFPSNGQGIIQLLFSTDGKFLSLQWEAGSGSRLRLWDLDRRSTLIEIEGVSAHAAANEGRIHFRDDGTGLLVGMAEGSLRLYELPSGRLERQVSPAEPGRPGPLALHPFRDAAAVCGDSWSPLGNTIFVRDLATGAIENRFDYPDRVYGLAWHPEGRLLAAACIDSLAYVTDVEARRQQAVCRGALTATVGVAFSHDGALLATATWDNRLRLWDPYTGRLRVEAVGATSGRWLGFDRTDRLLAFTANTPTVSLWEVAASRECRILRGHGMGEPLHTVEFSPDGRLIAAASHEGVDLWDLARGREAAFLPIPGCSTATFHPSGSHLLATGNSGLHRWAIENTGGSSRRFGAPVRVESAVRGPLGKASLSRDGRTLAVIHGHHVHVLDLETAEDSVLAGFHPAANWVQITSDGKWIATSAWNENRVRAWDAASGACVLKRDFESGCIIAFSPDGKLLSISDGRQFHLLETGTWRPLRILPRELQDLPSVMGFSPDGRLFAAPRSTRVVRLHDLETGLPVADLESPHQATINCLAFSPDGRRLAVGTSGHSIQLWDLAAIRDRLASMGLDWEGPRPAPEAAVPIDVEVVPGPLSPPLTAPENSLLDSRCATRVLLRTSGRLLRRG
jgi:serine/threonine protein kinase/WD40 repeat protein